MIFAVSYKDVEQVWPKIRQQVQKACDAPSVPLFNHLHIEAKLQSRDMQLWVTKDYKGIFITEIIKHPLAKECRIKLAAGEDMDEWLVEMVSTIKNWARGMGCDFVEGAGRKGWAKIPAKYPELKFKHESSVVISEINYA